MEILMLSGVVSLHFTSFAIGYAVQAGSGSDMCYIFHSEKFVFFVYETDCSACLNLVYTMALIE